MKWADAVERMERDVIKKDGTAMNEPYFMATHVPFQELEVTAAGQMHEYTKRMSEEEIYQELLVNPGDRHQMVIVRGSNGTGKSHLICWMHAKYRNDADHYQPEREKVVFLRRLGNTIRGAIQQLLDEGLVQNKDLLEKFHRFLSATASQSEDEFKTTIFNAFVGLVQNDKSGGVYKPVLCRDIASFLYDQRIREFLMRPEGPISRCYRAITAGTDTSSAGDPVFVSKDFSFPKEIVRQLRRQAAEEVKAFWDGLHADTHEVDKLVAYLNQYTSKVLQSCASITSESARDLFVDLRRSLKKQGKSLTLFIEDFTSFSIVESELITALAVEHGGEYADLCRVTSVIGITDGYYEGLFRDNFKDRVTHQIHVTEGAFSSEAFLAEMAARYLNAIYCEPEQLSHWYASGAEQDKLPLADFAPSYKWDSYPLNGNPATLFPFNRRSLQRLYVNLRHQTPRYFLVYVIQTQFKEFADGKIYGADWSFPTHTHFNATLSMEPAYAEGIDRDDSITAADKRRLKFLLDVWGDATTNMRDDCVGQVPVTFLQELGFYRFTGIITDAAQETHEETQQPSHSRPAGMGGNPTAPPSNVESPQDRRHRLRLEALANWQEKGGDLGYAADFRKYLGDFVKEAVNWQDEGIPGYVAKERLNAPMSLYIEGQSSGSDKGAIIILRRSPEASVILYGLAQQNHHSGWFFENAAYYQGALVNWLETNKAAYKAAISAIQSPEESPLLKYCLAVEYLKRCLLGNAPKGTSPENIVTELLEPFTAQYQQQRSNPDWNRVIQGLFNVADELEMVNATLRNGANTYMGALTGSGGDKQFFRTVELVNAVEELEAKGWDIRTELAGAAWTEPLARPVRRLKDLYEKLDFLLLSEQKIAKNKLKKLEGFFDGEPTEAAVLDLTAAMGSMKTNLSYANFPMPSELIGKYTEYPEHTATTLIKKYRTLANILEEQSVIRLLRCFSADPVECISAYISDFNEIERIALTQEQKFIDQAVDAESGGRETIDQALQSLQALQHHLERWETAYAVS